MNDSLNASALISEFVEDSYDEKAKTFTIGENSLIFINKYANRLGNTQVFENYTSSLNENVYVNTLQYVIKYMNDFEISSDDYQNVWVITDATEENVLYYTLSDILDSTVTVVWTAIANN